MRLLECILQKNECYVKYHLNNIQPTGITVHSTDFAGKILRRFINPFAGQTQGLMDNGQAVTAARMIEILGKNQYNNDWNRPGVYKAVHAFLGQMADGNYAVCKALDYTQPCWGGAFGSKGSYDGRIKKNGEQVAGGKLHINFEMIESPKGDNDKAHCKALYDLAVEYCVYLCTLFPTINLDDIVSHKEANARGYASGHGDPEVYWQRCGMSYTMDGFRAAVRAKLAAQNAAADPIYRIQIGAFRNRAYADAFLAEVKAHYPNAYMKVGA